MKKTDKRGGRRPGAGRKRKWSFRFTIEVGLACEKLFNEALEDTRSEVKQKLLSEQSNLSEEFHRAHQIQTNNRSNWLNQEEGGDQYLWDVAGEIEQLNIQYKNQNRENRVFSLPTRPPRGTRKAIIQQISAEYSLTKNQVDNLWQAYRRFTKTK